MAGEVNSGIAGRYAFDQLAAQAPQPGRLVRPFGSRQTERAGQADRPGNILGPRTQASLLPAAVECGPQLRSTPDIERSHTSRTVQLVGGEREEVDAQMIDVERKGARGLDRVGVKRGRRVALPDGSPQVGDRLDGADLVVHVHDGDENGLLA